MWRNAKLLFLLIIISASSVIPVHRSWHHYEVSLSPLYLSMNWKYSSLVIDWISSRMVSVQRSWVLYKLSPLHHLFKTCCVECRCDFSPIILILQVCNMQKSVCLRETAADAMGESEFPPLNYHGSSEVVGVPSLEAFKAALDGAVSKLARWKVSLPVAGDWN